MLVTALCGFWPHATAEVVDRLLADSPVSRLVRYQAPGPGKLTRAAGGDVPAGGDPAAALVRELVEVARDRPGTGVLVVLPEAYEPDQIRTA